MKLVLFTTHCPKCKVLEEKLEKSGVEYEIWEDVDAFMTKYPNVTTAPQLEVHDGDSVSLLGFVEANSFISKIIKNH